MPQDLEQFLVRIDPAHFGLVKLCCPALKRNTEHDEVVIRALGLWNLGAEPQFDVVLTSFLVL